MLPVPAFPRRLNVEVTNHCNQRCPLCPRRGFTRPLGFMDPDLFGRLAAECAGHPTRLWLHFLGEPLLHRHLVDFIVTAKRLGVAEVGLSTNAVGLNAEYADRLLGSGLDRLECSMDAIDRHGYATMRGRDHFDRVTANVLAFLTRKRERGLARPLTSIQFLRTQAVDGNLPAIVAAWRPHLDPGDFVMTIQPATFIGAVAVAPVNGTSPAGARLPCRWLVDALVVLQDGTVTMCGPDWDAHAPLGHLRDSTLTAIWTGAEMARRRAAHVAGRFAAVGPCTACRDWRLADGHGYVNALAEVDGVPVSVTSGAPPATPAEP